MRAILIAVLLLIVTPVHPLETGYAELAAIRLFYVKAGEGPLMLFLHGAPDDWSLYESQMREFGRDHLVIAPNLRGFPPSDAPPAVEDYSAARVLDDIHDLLQFFKQERVILVGNDWGGYFAVLFASAYPQHVERLVLLNAAHPAIFLREAYNNPEQNQASQYERGNRTAAAPYPAWMNYYRADPIIVPPAVESPPFDAAELAARLLRGVRVPPQNTSLKAEQPSLVIWGMKDPALRPGLLDGLRDYLPNSEIFAIDDADHYPMRTHPAIVNARIRAFLSR
jgi:epoxide hydrolase 4